MVAVAAAIVCASICAAAPYAANRLMRSRRAAHKAWFASGAAAYARNAREGRVWAQALPRLVNDRAISREDARAAASLGVPGLPDASALPTTAELDERFRLESTSAANMGLLMCCIGLAYGLGLPLLDMQPMQVVALGCVLAVCALMAVVDIRCRMIPNIVVLSLCALGIALRATCASAAGPLAFELLALASVAVVICGGMYIFDAISARMKNGCRPIGDGDKKVMAAIVFCSGAAGLASAWIALVVSLLTAVTVLKDRKAKQAFGPFAALATIIGATASVMVRTQ